jgi:hypothetical protein
MGDVIKVDSLSFCVKSALARAFLINFGISRILPSLLPLSEPSLGIERGVLPRAAPQGCFCELALAVVPCLGAAKLAWGDLLGVPNVKPPFFYFRELVCTGDFLVQLGCSCMACPLLRSRLDSLMFVSPMLDLEGLAGRGLVQWV